MQYIFYIDKLIENKKSLKAIYKFWSLNHLKFKLHEIVEFQDIWGHLINDLLI